MEIRQTFIKIMSTKNKGTDRGFHVLFSLNDKKMLNPSLNGYLYEFWLIGPILNVKTFDF